VSNSYDFSTGYQASMQSAEVAASVVEFVMITVLAGEVLPKPQPVPDSRVLEVDRFQALLVTDNDQGKDVRATISLIFLIMFLAGCITPVRQAVPRLVMSRP